MPKPLIILLFIFIPFQLKSQILPKDGSKLNYRIIGFSFPALPHANKYKIEIALGNYDSPDLFGKNIVSAVESKDNKVIAEVPYFGSQYTWRIVYTGKDIGNKTSDLYHFSTLMNKHIDTTMLRLRVLQPAEQQYKDDYIGLDAGGVLYDMSGHAVWFIPDTNGFSGNVACLQFTPQGTITFIYRPSYEIDYNCNIVWKTPDNTIINGDTVRGELYHHEFTKLSNGHFMTLGMEVFMCKQGLSKDSSYIIVSPNKEQTETDGFKLGRFGVIIEYDEKGNVVWSWKTSDYLLKSDFVYFNPVDSNSRFDPHDNAFFFDEKNKVIYLGFKNLNRIIKIEYPSGKILRTYGEIFQPGAKSVGAGLFCNQHSLGLTQDGYLYYFNNNSCQDNVPPSVVILKEPVRPTGGLEKIWEYPCPIEGEYKNFASGGNAIELPDRSMFINMGGKYSRLLIVNREKKILWSALPERYVVPEIKWAPLHEYRANIISRDELERMIWRAETLKPQELRK